jgi:hypothetical protein
VIPVYGFVEGDTLGLLVLLEPADTARTVADKLESAASVRVAPGSLGAARAVVHAGRTLAPEMTVAAAGIAALDRIDLVSGSERG